MRQSLFDDEERMIGRANVAAGAADVRASRLLAYAVAAAGAALIVAVIALAVALLK